jgi:hypothetical protein
MADMHHEDIYDAIGTAVLAAGGYKRVAGKLWPSKSPQSAYAHLKNCLRDDKAEKLDPAELVRIMQMARDVGEHAVMHHLADACHYTRPEPVDPETERDRLHREVLEMGGRLERMLAELRQADSRLRSVK